MHDRADAIEWQHEPLPYQYFNPDPPVDDAASEPDDPPLDEESPRPSGFAEWFALSLTFLPAMLFLPGSQAYRLPLRVGAYALSIFAFVLWWFDRAGYKEGKHPAERYMLLVLVVLAMGLAHPLTSSLESGDRADDGDCGGLRDLPQSRARVAGRRRGHDGHVRPHAHRAETDQTCRRLHDAGGRPGARRSVARDDPWWREHLQPILDA